MVFGGRGCSTTGRSTTGLSCCKNTGMLNYHSQCQWWLSSIRQGPRFPDCRGERWNVKCWIPSLLTVFFLQYFWMWVRREAFRAIFFPQKEHVKGFLWLCLHMHSFKCTFCENCLQSVQVNVGFRSAYHLIH